MNKCDYPATKAYLIGCSDEGLDILFDLVVFERAVRNLMREPWQASNHYIPLSVIREAHRRLRDSTETANSSGNSDRASDKGVPASQPNRGNVG